MERRLIDGEEFCGIESQPSLLRIMGVVRQACRRCGDWWACSWERVQRRALVGVQRRNAAGGCRGAGPLTGESLKGDSPFMFARPPDFIQHKPNYRERLLSRCKDGPLSCIPYNFSLCCEGAGGF